MTRVFVAVLALLAAAPRTLAGQTCLGVVYLAVGDSASMADSASWFEVEATPLAVRSGASIADGLTFDAAMGETRSATGRLQVAPRKRLLEASALPAGARLAPGRVLQLRWGCMMYAARMVLRRGEEEMTLDLLEGPDHPPVSLDGPIPFRAGHYALSLKPDAAAGHAVSARSLVPVP